MTWLYLPLRKSWQDDMPEHPVTWDPDSIEPPDFPQPEGWAKPREVSEIDLVLDTSLVENPTVNFSTSKEL